MSDNNKSPESTPAAAAAPATPTNGTRKKALGGGYGPAATGKPAAERTALAGH